MSKNKAILIIGPTGSGKTPLGELLQRKGIKNKRCFHFDFGEELRRTAGVKKQSVLFNSKEMAFIRKVLDSGALLETDAFYIARKVFELFIARHNIGTDDIIILNGWPRHLGQAKEIDSILNINQVLHLVCKPEVVYDRIKNNAGGDRTNRFDDGFKAVKNKLNIFVNRTAPLIKYYRNQGAKIVEINIGSKTTPEEIRQRLNRKSSWIPTLGLKILTTVLK